MRQLINQESQIQKPSQRPIQRELGQARYIYCISQFNCKQINCINCVGIEGNPVRVVRVKELCALVHNCEASPYATKNSAQAKKWVMEHENVVEKALQKMEAVIPFTFDTIFKEESQLIEFLKLNMEKIKEKLKQLEGKREFGIKIFYDESLQEQIEKEKVKQLKELEVAEKESKGKAYFLRKKIEREISVELQGKLKFFFEEFYKKISTCGEIIVENIKENEFVNFSCLVLIDKIKELSKVLDEINRPPFKVRFTGPWPPYSFASKIFEEKNDK